MSALLKLLQKQVQSLTFTEKQYKIFIEFFCSVVMLCYKKKQN